MNKTDTKNPTRGGVNVVYVDFKKKPKVLLKSSKRIVVRTSSKR